MIVLRASLEPTMRQVEKSVASAEGALQASPDPTCETRDQWSDSLRAAVRQKPLAWSGCADRPHHTLKMADLAAHESHRSIREGDVVKVWMVLTSQGRMGDTGHKTGFWLEEFAAP